MDAVTLAETRNTWLSPPPLTVTPAAGPVIVSAVLVLLSVSWVPPRVIVWSVAKIPAVLHLQPCYCYCDRMGHNSLHSCFESTHGARCDICLKELYYAYSETKNGKTATQVRKGIMQGDWRQVNLETAAASN